MGGEQAGARGAGASTVPQEEAEEAQGQDPWTAQAGTLVAASACPADEQEAAMKQLDVTAWRMLWTVHNKPDPIPLSLFLRMPEEMFDHLPEHRHYPPKRRGSFRRVRVIDEFEVGHTILTIQRFVYNQTKRFDVRGRDGRPFTNRSYPTFAKAVAAAYQHMQSERITPEEYAELWNKVRNKARQWP
jgi:hypothetical protein